MNQGINQAMQTETFVLTTLKCPEQKRFCSVGVNMKIVVYCSLCPI